MLRFDKFIRASMTVREVKVRYPRTETIFAQMGFRDVCDDCSIEVAAGRQGLRGFEIVDSLNSFIFSRTSYVE